VALAPVVVLAVAEPVQAQDLVPVDDPTERLDRWLALQRHDIQATRYLAGPVSIGVGAAMVGAGVYGLADRVYDRDPNLAWLQLGVGGLGVAKGVVWLLIQPEAEGRWRRWRAARRHGLTDEERLRFEGELRATPFVAQAQRSLYRWSGLGLIFGGAVTLGTLAAQEGLPRRHAVLGWTTAGAYTGIGVALLVASFVPSFGEDAWDRYREGLAPARPRAEVRVVPWATPGAAGLSLVGRR